MIFRMSLAHGQLISVLFIMCSFIESSTSSTSIGEFQIPFKWIKAPLLSTYSSAMIPIFNTATDSVYLCGGKISTTSKSSKCITINTAQSTDSCGRTSLSIKQSDSGGNGLKSTGQYPGIYFNVNGFASETQNAGGIYGDRMCMLSVSDSTQFPKSLCCNSAKSECIDLMYSAQSVLHVQRFDSCVTYDASSKILFNIGGYYGQTLFASIICFDVKTETFLTAQECNYGILDEAVYGLGCAVLPDDESSIVAAGGLNSLSTSTSTEYSSDISICKNGNCDRLNALKLPKGVIKSRIFAIGSCHIGIAGGMIKENGVQAISANLEVANICEQSLIYSDSLPVALSEFGLIQTNDFFCLYGGIVFDEETNLPQVSQSAYCVKLDPTKAPTSFPTVPPTQLPTTWTEFTSSSIATTSVIVEQGEDLGVDVLWLVFAGAIGFLIVLLAVVGLYAIWKMYAETDDASETEDNKPIDTMKMEVNNVKMIDCITPLSPQKTPSEGKERQSNASNNLTLC